jgi:putative ABC transport system substrate-binding protein
VTILAPELSSKRLEVLSEIVPGLSRVAALWDPTSGNAQVGMAESAGRAMKMQLQILQVRRRDDLVGAFAAAKKAEAQAVSVFASPVLASLTREIVDLAAEHRLPAIYQWREQVEAGGLVSYGPSLAGMWRQVGAVAAKLLKGAKAAEMPIEQPTKFELAINMKTAKAMGLTISETFLVRADTLIE